MHARDAALDGAFDGRCLGEHSTGEHTLLAQLAEPCQVHVGNQCRRILKVAENAGRRHGENELRGLERLRERARHGVGVDVEQPALHVRGKGAHHWHPSLVQEDVQRRRVDGLDVSHESEVHGIRALPLHVHGRTARGRDQTGVHSRDADGPKSFLPAGAQQRRVDLAAQHLGGDAQILGTRDPATRHHSGLVAQAAREFGGLGPAAVHENQADPQGVEDAHLLHESIDAPGALQDLAAHLEDEDALAEEAHVGRGRAQAGKPPVGCSQSLHVASFGMARRASASCAASDARSVSGGMTRSHAGSELVPARMSWSSSASRTSRAEVVHLSPSSMPRPRIPSTGPVTQLARSSRSRIAACCRSPSSRMVSSTASITAHASGPPPKVLPMSPIRS